MFFAKHFKLHYWPAVTSAWFLLSFAVSYLISTLNGHVQEIFPFMSDTGATPPESSVLGQMLNIGAVFMAVTMYIRYRQVELAIASKSIVLKRGWNNAAFWTGNIVCLGVSMVGNFQKPSMILMHFIGAFMAFGISAFYLLIQTRISYAYRFFYDKYPEFEIGKSILYFRLFLTICHFITFITVVVCGVISSRKIKGTNLSWSQEVEGYEIHLAATLTEWIMFLSFISYTLTGTKEFKSLEYEEIRFILKRGNDKV